MANLRSLRILATTPHDDICGARLGSQVLLIHIIALSNLLEQARCARNHAADIFPRIR